MKAAFSLEGGGYKSMKAAFSPEGGEYKNIKKQDVGVPGPGGGNKKTRMKKIVQG